MRVGIVVPSFRADTATALRLAARAEGAGLDGVFVYDHLFPIGGAGRPAMHGPTLVGALLASTKSIRVGTLVSRVGLLPDDLMVATFRTLEAIGPGRIIAGLGLGDSASDPERHAYGLERLALEDRVESLRRVTELLTDDGVEVWIGGRGRQARDLARAGATGWNGWDATSAELDEMRAERLVTSWAGPLPNVALEQHITSSHADWVIYAPVDINRDEAVAGAVIEQIAMAAARSRA